jgi:hypothetical protein
MAVQVLIGFGIAVLWAGSLLVKPFGKCWLCRGKRVLRHGRRASRCPACKGMGRRQRFGSKTVHRIRRQVVGHWRGPQ